MYTKVKQGVVTWATGSMTAVSGALALFCIYNILAGGNPPAKKGPAIIVADK
jgi:hypothetical protein